MTVPIDDRSREPLEDVESEGIGHTYEEISDEEGLDEVGSLDELMDTVCINQSWWRTGCASVEHCAPFAMFAAVSSVPRLCTKRH